MNIRIVSEKGAVLSVTVPFDGLREMKTANCVGSLASLQFAYVCKIQCSFLPQCWHTNIKLFTSDIRSGRAENTGFRQYWLGETPYRENSDQCEIRYSIKQPLYSPGQALRVPGG